MRRINWPIFWLGNIFGLLETAHFGWNFTAQSDAEMVCDGITFLIVALAWVVPSRSPTTERQP